MDKKGFAIAGVNMRRRRLDRLVKMAYVSG
jgi:hypothetical protein